MTKRNFPYFPHDYLTRAKIRENTYHFIIQGSASLEKWGKLEELSYKFRFVKFKSALYLKNNGIIYHFRNHTMPLLLFPSIHQTKHIPVYDNIIYRIRLVQL